MEQEGLIEEVDEAEGSVGFQPLDGERSELQELVVELPVAVLAHRRAVAVFLEVAKVRFCKRIGSNSLTH